MTIWGTLISKALIKSSYYIQQYVISKFAAPLAPPHGRLEAWVTSYPRAKHFNAALVLIFMNVSYNAFLENWVLRPHFHSKVNLNRHLWWHWLTGSNLLPMWPASQKELPTFGGQGITSKYVSSQICLKFC